MSVGADFTTAIGLAGLLSSPNPAGGAFDLNDLDQHNFPIEHDGSLSRRDAFFGNDYSFFMPNFQMVLDHFNGSYTSIPTASKAKYSRVQNSRAINPTFTYGPREFILSYGETSLYLQTMSDPYSGVARVDFIKYFFEYERLPTALGWKPSNQTITLLTLGQMIMELYAANSGDQAPEGLLVTTDAYKGECFVLLPASCLVADMALHQMHSKVSIQSPACLAMRPVREILQCHTNP